MEEEMQEAKNKFLKNILNEGMANEEDVAQAMGVILEVVAKIKEECEQKMAQNKDDMSESQNDTLKKITEIENDLNGRIKTLAEKEGVDIANIRDYVSQKVKDVEALIPQVKDYDKEIGDLGERVSVLEEKKVEIDFSPILKEVEGKLDELKKKLPDSERLDDIERIAKANSMPITTSFINGQRAKNLNFTNATVKVVGDTANITTTGTSEGGAVSSVNGATGDVILDADDISDASTTHKFVTAADITKLSNLSGTNTGDQDLSGLALKATTLTINGVTYDLSANRSWTVAGEGSGISRSIVITSGHTSAGNTALTDYVYLVSGAHTITMPTAVSNTNRYTIKNNHSANITINPAGAETLDGGASISLAPQESVDLISTNSNWSII